MPTISGANLKTNIDSLAKQISVLETVIGDTSTADTVLYGLAACITRVDGYDEDVQADLFKILVNAKEIAERLKTKLNHMVSIAIENHIRRLADKGLSDYWEAENYPTSRIPPEYAKTVRAIGHYLKAALVWSPVTAMGSFVVSGDAAGTFTDGSAIDGNLYGPADCELEVTAKGNETVSLVATVIGTDENGATMQGSATFSTAAIGDKVAVTPDDANKKFQDITNITITGGTADDAFKIQSKVDRALSM